MNNNNKEEEEVNTTSLSTTTNISLNTTTKLSLSTRIVHSEKHSNHYNASSMPIYQSATFNDASYDYSRSGNPTRTHVENHLAKLMSASHCYVVNSGMSALDVVLRLLKCGDVVICGDDLYGGSNRLLGYYGDRYGIIVRNVDTTSVDCVINSVCARTRMILLETPTNPMIKVCDISGIVDRIRKIRSDILVVVDNTMMSPYLQRPLELGADIVYHSGTKYLSGHHDLMAGVIGCRSSELGLYQTINATGCGLAPFDCFLLMRGIKTLAVRMDKQQLNAGLIALYLEKERGFKVYYPGLRSHPQYDVHNKQASGAGAVLSFETGDIGFSEEIVSSVRLWSVSVSFGCVNSLISMPCRMSHASIPESVRKERGLPEDLIRLCVGIEDVDDLLEDLRQALKKAIERRDDLGRKEC